MIYSTVEFRDKIRRALVKTPTKRFTMEELRMLVPDLIEVVDNGLPKSFDRLNFWVDKIDRDAEVVNANFEFVQFGITNGLKINGDTSLLASPLDIRSILERNKIEVIWRVMNGNDVIQAEMDICVLINDFGKDIRMDHECNIGFISPSSLHKVIAREAMSNKLKEYAMLLYEIESIYEHEQKEILFDCVQLLQSKVKNIQLSQDRKSASTSIESEYIDDNFNRSSKRKRCTPPEQYYQSNSSVDPGEMKTENNIFETNIESPLFPAKDLSNQCIGATMVNMYINCSPKIRIFIHRGSLKNVLKKMEERITGDYTTNTYIPIVKPHYVMIPPICCENIDTIAQNVLFVYGQARDDIISRFNAELTESKYKKMNSKNFPIQFRKSFITFGKNDFLTIKDIRNIYIEEIKKSPLVCLIADGIHKCITNQCSLYKRELKKATCANEKKLIQEMINVSNDINKDEFCGIINI